MDRKAVLKRLDEEMAAQGAVDAAEVSPPEKLRRREEIRHAADDDLGTGSRESKGHRE